MLCSEDRQVDASVCACLGVVDQGFDAETEQEILEDKARSIQWLKELKRRKELTGAHDIAKDPIQGAYSYLAELNTPDLPGNTDVPADETNPGVENHVGYIADMLGNITIATRPPSSVAAESQNDPETEGGDGVVKMKRNKRKREQKKRAKARAKEAAANAEDIVGNNDDDDNDRDVPNLAPL